MSFDAPAGAFADALAADLLILGLGNRLMTDDAAGPLVIERLAARPLPPGARAIDGGTCGLALLPDLERAAALIVVDAARSDAPPGAVTVFEGAAMDAALRGAKSTAHEVALADLMDALHVTSGRPARRALVAIEPERIGVGLEPTKPVDAALAGAVSAVRALVERWAP